MKRILNEMKRMQELAGIISEAKVESAELEAQIREFQMLHEKFTEAKKHFMGIEAEFRVAEDVVRKALESIDESEEKILELEDIAVRIKSKGSTKTTFPYKLIAETLYARVNGKLKEIIDELMDKESKVHEVKSTIELKKKGLEESLSISKLMSKAGEYVTGLFGKLGRFLGTANSELDGYIDELREILKDGGQEGEGSFLNEEMGSSNDLAFRIDDILKKVKQLSRPVDARNEMFQANTAMTAEVKKGIESLMDEFIKSDKTSAWPIFQQQANDPKALEEAKRQFVYNEVDNRISNFFFNSGSGSFVRAFGNPYKIQVVQEMKKVADELKLARLARGLQGAVDAYKRDYKPEESAIDKLRAQAGIQPKVTSESKRISLSELREMVENMLYENDYGKLDWVEELEIDEEGKSGVYDVFHRLRDGEIDIDGRELSADEAKGWVLDNLKKIVKFTKDGFNPFDTVDMIV